MDPNALALQAWAAVLELVANAPLLTAGTGATTAVTSGSLVHW